MKFSSSEFEIRLLYHSTCSNSIDRNGYRNSTICVKIQVIGKLNANTISSFGPFENAFFLKEK